MSPASLLVLGTATVLVSPALWDAVVLGELPLHVAITRYLVAVVGCWFVLSMAVSLLPQARRTPQGHASGPGADPATSGTVPPAGASSSVVGLQGNLPPEPGAAAIA